MCRNVSAGQVLDCRDVANVCAVHLCVCVCFPTVAGVSEAYEDAANCLWLLTNSKPCANCKSPIQKNEGCNHMQCAKVNTKLCLLCLHLKAWMLIARCINFFFSVFNFIPNKLTLVFFSLCSVSMTSVGSVWRSGRNTAHQQVATIAVLAMRSSSSLKSSPKRWL